MGVGCRRTQHGGSTGAPTLGRGLLRGTPCLVSPRQEGTECPGPLVCLAGLLCPGGPRRAGRPLGSHTDPVWRDPSSPVSREAGLGSPPTTRKETLVAIGCLSSGTMPQGDLGKLQVSVRRGQRSLLMRSPPQGQCLCAARPGGLGETSRGVRVRGPVSGRPCPMCLAPLTPTLASSLWGPRGPGIPHLHTCPHLGLGLTPPPSHPPPTTGPPKPALMGIRSLP